MLKGKKSKKFEGKMNFDTSGQIKGKHNFYNTIKGKDKFYKHWDILIRTSPYDTIYSQKKNTTHPPCISDLRNIRI